MVHAHQRRLDSGAQRERSKFDISVATSDTLEDLIAWPEHTVVRSLGPSVQRQLPGRPFRRLRRRVSRFVASIPLRYRGVAAPTGISLAGSTTLCSKA